MWHFECRTLYRRVGLGCFRHSDCLWCSSLWFWNRTIVNSFHDKKKFRKEKLKYFLVDGQNWCSSWNCVTYCPNLFVLLTNCSFVRPISKWDNRTLCHFVQFWNGTCFVLLKSLVTRASCRRLRLEYIFRKNNSLQLLTHTK